MKDLACNRNGRREWKSFWLIMESNLSLVSTCETKASVFQIRHGEYCVLNPSQASYHIS